MNEKEVAELRRRIRPEKQNISQICGCYVNEKREIVSMFGQSLTLMSEQEADAYLTILRKTLSGQLGKNLIDISFSTKQVADSEEHRLLMALRDSGLKNEAAVRHFFEVVIDGLQMEGQYLILLAADKYDVPWRGADDSSMADASTDIFSYILCAVCPVKQTKPVLRYDYDTNAFAEKAADTVVAPPELGFLFPAFDDRSANLYNALYYTKNTAENRQDFVDAVFRQELPMPAQAQKETFEYVLGESLAEDSRFDVVQQVHEQLREKILVHKESKDPEPLTLSRSDVEELLENSGVGAERVEQFGRCYDEQFGTGTDLSAKNLVDVKKFKVTTPDVIIQVDPDRSDLIQTRIIDGIRYILIHAGEGVEVNGVAIRIPDEEE